MFLTHSPGKDTVWISQIESCSWSTCRTEVQFCLYVSWIGLPAPQVFILLLYPPWATFTVLLYRFSGACAGKHTVFTVGLMSGGWDWTEVKEEKRQKQLKEVHRGADLTCSQSQLVKHTTYTSSISFIREGQLSIIHHDFLTVFRWLWFGSDTKNTWKGLGKDHTLS